MCLRGDPLWFWGSVDLLRGSLIDSQAEARPLHPAPASGQRQLLPRTAPGAVPVRHPSLGEIYHHEDLGRVRVKKLPRDRPRGALVSILSHEGRGDRLVEVEREKLSEYNPDWKDGGFDDDKPRVV